MTIDEEMQRQIGFVGASANVSITEQDLQEAEQQYANAVVQLQKHQHSLALAERQLSADRLSLEQLQKSVERKRLTVNQLQSQVDLFDHKCLEIRVELEKVQLA
jgi:chromosome segregation ATPase